MIVASLLLSGLLKEYSADASNLLGLRVPVPPGTYTIDMPGSISFSSKADDAIPPSGVTCRTVVPLPTTTLSPLWNGPSTVRWI